MLNTTMNQKPILGPPEPMRDGVTM